MDTEPVLRTRVLHDLGHGRTSRQIAGRLKLEAGGESAEPMEGSIPAGGARISHEALYTWIYALPKGEVDWCDSEPVNAEEFAHDIGDTIHGAYDSAAEYTVAIEGHVGCTEG